MVTTTEADGSRVKVVFYGDLETGVPEETVHALRRKGYDVDYAEDDSVEDGPPDEADCVVVGDGTVPTPSENDFGSKPVVFLYNETPPERIPDSFDPVHGSGGYVPERLAARLAARLGSDGDGDRPAQEDGHFSLNRDWEFTRVNDRAGEILGRDPDELVGENVWDELPESVGASFYENYHRAMVEREPVSFEEFYEPLGALFRVNAYPSDDGVSVHFRSVTEDDSDDFLEARATDKSGVGLCTVDPRTRTIEYVDEGFESLTGYSEGSAVGEPLDLLYGADTDEAAVDEIRAAFENERSTDVRLVLQRRDGVRYWSHVYVTPIYDGGELAYYLCSQRDVSEIKKAEDRLRERNRYLAAVRDAEEELISVSSLEGVGEVLVEYAREFFDDVSFYVWEDGVLRSDDDDISGNDDPTWKAFTESEPIVDEDDDGVRIEMPVGSESVLSLRSRRYSDAKEDFVSSLVSGAETALGRIDREEELRGLTRELESKNEELRRLTEIDVAVRRLVRKILRLDGRETIERTVCEHLLEIEGWDYVRVAKVDEGFVETRQDSGNDPAFSERIGSVDGDSPAAVASETKEPVVVRDVALEEASDWRTATLDQGYLSVASVPIVHRVRSFGVLEVYSEESGAFEDQYSEALVDAVSVLGYSLASAERKDMVMSGGYNRLRLRLDEDADDTPALFARELGSEVEVEAVAPREDGALLYFETDAEEEAVEGVADRHGITLDGGPPLYEAEVVEPGLLEYAGEAGGRVVRYTAADGDLSAEVDLPRDVDAADFVESLSEIGYPVDVTAKTSRSASPESPSMEELTDRQAEALRVAYLNGFFDWPRETDGNELAESLGIARSTLHQHLRAAEKKLVQRAVEREE